VSALLLVALCLHAAPDAGARGFRWEHPSGIVQEIDIPGEVKTNGVPVVLHALVLRGAPAQLGDFYRRSFIKQGLFVGAGQNLEQGVTGYDDLTRTSYTVILQKKEDGLCTVVLGQADLRNPLQAGDEPPRLPGAKGMVRSTQEGMSLWTYEVRASDFEIDSFYESTLVAAGWTQEAPRTFRKGAQQLKVRVHDLDGKRTVQLQQLTAPAEPKR
jgi:hypothetical protein